MFFLLYSFPCVLIVLSHYSRCWGFSGEQSKHPYLMKLTLEDGEILIKAR